jgi:peptide/nickel transport system permease protein
MFAAIAKRIGYSLLLVFGLTTIVFLFAHIAPGDPVMLVVSPTTPPAIASELHRQFGLDQPLPVQYVRWLASTLQGNLGVSFTHHRPVLDIIGDMLPNTAALALSAIFLELMIGISTGLLSSRHEGSLLDRFLSTTSLIVYTLPTFWIGVVLLALFSYGLGYLPSSQLHSLDSDHLSSLGRVFDMLKHLALPALTLALPGAAEIARYFRSSLLNVLGEEYITVARSTGMNPRRLFFLYELPNAIVPIITLTGMKFGTLLGGAVVTETIFALPGMGRLAVLAIFSRDYPLIMGCALVSGILVIAGNILADVLYGVVDPRVRGTT